MNDGLGFEQQEPPIEIDARSPGERWVQSGRVEFERFRVVLEGARLDALALAWMVLVIVFTGVQIYQALRLGTLGLFPGSARDWWTKLGFLSQSGGVLLIFGGIAAIGMAAFFDTPVARMTLRLAILGGAWSVVAAGFGVAYALHNQTGVSFVQVPGETKTVQALTAASIGGLGLVMALIAWRMSARPSAKARSAEPELAELS